MKYLVLICITLILILPGICSVKDNFSTPSTEINELDPGLIQGSPAEIKVVEEDHERSTRANGVGDQTPFSNDWVEGVYNIEFQEPAFVNIDASFEVYEIYLGTVYGNVTSADIRAWAGGDPGSTVITYLKSHVEKNIFSKFLEITFPNGDYNYQSSVVSTSSLTLSGYVIIDEHAYFTDTELNEYNITNVNELIDGSLKMGAKITQTLKLAAKAGHSNEFEISVPKYSIYQHPDQLTISHPNDEDRDSDYIVVKRIDNKDGNVSESEYLHDIVLKSANPTPALKTGVKEDVNIQLEIDVVNFDEIYIRDSLLEISVVDLRESNIDLPQNITDLFFMSSDGIRLFYENGVIDENDIRDEIDGELTKTSESLEERLNSTHPIDLELTWDFASINALEPLYYLEDTGVYTRMGVGRSVKGYIKSTDMIEPHFFETNLTQNAIFGFLNAGAEAEINLRLKIKYDYKLNLTLPEGLRLKGELGRPGVRDSYLIPESETDDIIVISKNAPVYYSNQALIYTLIDIKELDMKNFNQFVSEVKIEVEGTLHRILSSAHSSFNTILPPEVTMTYVNSDAFRLAYYENLIDLKEITDEIYDIIQSNLTNVFEGNITPSIKFDEKSMKFDGDINDMDDDAPIKFTITAEGEMNIGSGGGGTFGSLMGPSQYNYDDLRLQAFISHEIELPLVGKHGWNTTYKIIMPRYIEIVGTPKLENLTGTTTDIETGTADEGRHYMKITIFSDDPGVKNIKAVIGIEINITPWYFMSKIIIPIILSLILLIIIIYIYILRRKKRKALEKETGVAGVTVQDLTKYDEKKMKGKGKKKYPRGEERDRDSNGDLVIEEYPEEEPFESSSQETGKDKGDKFMPSSFDRIYPPGSTKTDYKRMVKDMVPKHKGKLERGKRKKSIRKKSRIKKQSKRKGKGKGKKKLATSLSIFLLLLSILTLYPPLTTGQPNDEYISSPSNIPLFEFFTTSTIVPSESEELSFNLINRYSFNMENVTLKLNIFRYVTLDKSKDIGKVDSPPTIVHGSGGTRYTILDSQSILFQWTNFQNNSVEQLKIKISTSKSTSQGTYFIRMNLTFEYQSEIYIMKSRGYYSQAEWDLADLTAAPTDPGEINLTALDVDGIIPDTSFRVKDPIPFWPLVMFIGFCVVFAFLAGLFYMMDEQGKFPELKIKIDRVSEKVFRKKHN
jgi:hypothetical protein